MRQQWIQIDGIPALLWGDAGEKLFLFVHGQNGSKEEAAPFSQAACRYGWQVLSVDLPGHGERSDREDAFVPWRAVPELARVMAYAKTHWPVIALRADSIGAWFSMLAFSAEPLERSLFVSPILDMEQLIAHMMRRAGVTDWQLQKAGNLPAPFGQTLSWDYLCYAREHPICRWDPPTAILYGDGDTMTPRRIVDGFAARFGCRLTVMERGEHWFHMPDQLAVLEDWTEAQLRGGPGK